MRTQREMNKLVLFYVVLALYYYNERGFLHDTIIIQLVLNEMKGVENHSMFAKPYYM